MSKNFDIFISYRRKETADKAEHLFDLLEEDTHWYEELARCSVSEFPGIETEMKESGASLDFVRLEIARAIAKGKHIIPVVPVNTPEYNFDRLVLPDDIALLLKEHAEHYQDTKDFLFKDILPKITKRLKSKPNRNGWLKWAFMMLLLLAIVAVIATWMKWSNERDQFENCRTQSDYEQFSANNVFFAGQCRDSLQMFASLKSPYVQINDSKNTERNKRRKNP